MIIRPDCADFLMAAIRNLRRKSPNVTPGTFPGISLGRVGLVAMALYEESLVRDTLRKLLASERVAIIARGWLEKDDGLSDFRLMEVPENVPPCLWGQWCITTDGKVEEWPSKESACFIKNVRIYVAADGLSKEALRVLRKHNSTASLARKIAESIEHK